MNLINTPQEQLARLQLHMGILWGSLKKVGSWIRFSKMLTSMLLKHLCLLGTLKAPHFTHSRSWKLPLLWSQMRTSFIWSPFIIHLSTWQAGDSPPRTLNSRGASLLPACSTTHPPGTGRPKEMFRAPVASVRSSWDYPQRAVFSALSRNFYFTGHTNPALNVGRGHALRVLSYQYLPSLY